MTYKETIERAVQTGSYLRFVGIFDVKDPSELEERLPFPAIGDVCMVNTVSKIEKEGAIIEAKEQNDYIFTGEKWLKIEAIDPCLPDYIDMNLFEEGLT